MKKIRDLCGDGYPLIYEAYWEKHSVGGKTTHAHKRFVEAVVSNPDKSKYELGYTKRKVDDYMSKENIVAHIEALQSMIDMGVDLTDRLEKEDLQAMIIQSYEICVNNEDAKGIRDCAKMLNDLFNVTDHHGDQQHTTVNIIMPDDDEE